MTRPPIKAGRNLFTFTLVLSLVSHAGVLGGVRLYSNASSLSNGSGPHEVELVAPPGKGISKRTGKAPSHSHRLAATNFETLQPSPSQPRVASLGEISSVGLPAGEAEAQPNAASGYGEDEVDEPARLLKLPRLRYPGSARREGLEGDVELYLIIDRDGKVLTAEVNRRAGRGFDEAALEAAQKLEFAPARKNGAPVKVHIHWVCHFRVQD